MLDWANQAQATEQAARYDAVLTVLRKSCMDKIIFRMTKRGVIQVCSRTIGYL